MNLRELTSELQKVEQAASANALEQVPRVERARQLLRELRSLSGSAETVTDDEARGWLFRGYRDQYCSCLPGVHRLREQAYNLVGEWLTSIGLGVDH